MKVIDVINRMKAYHKYNPDIKPDTTRDQILYGNAFQECTGIVTTCWATVDVIKEAAKLGANLIICHEALFWNHGDHQDWLQKGQNKTYLMKKELLDKYGIVVWRDHDYIHSGIPMGDGYVDGIFYGFAHQLGWVDYATDKVGYCAFEVPETTVKDVAQLMLEKFNFDGAKVLGSPDTKVKKAKICFHVFGDANDVIKMADQEDVDLLITLELIDFTLSEYIRDSSMLGLNKAIICLGHFNTEEPGMEYMVNYIPEAIGEDIPCTYVQSGDMYTYITK